MIGLLALLLPGTGNAQNGFNMPYSQFGTGLSELPYSLAMAARMGGVVYTRSGNNFVNPFNPASYAGIGMESFVFDMGANAQLTRLQNNSDHASDADGNLSHLAFAMPLTKWWKLAGGLIPYTTVDYESVTTGTYMDSGIVKNIYDGTGGSSLVFLGNAFNIIGDGTNDGRRLQLGFNVNYLTGHLQRAISYSFQGYDSTYYINKRTIRQTKLSNITFDLGLQYREPLGSRYTLGIGLVYKPYRDMNVVDEAYIYTWQPSTQTPYYTLYDTIFPLSGDPAQFDSRLEQAHTFGVGLSIERNNRWQVAFDATFAAWNGMKYTEGLTTNIFGTNAYRTGSWSRYAAGFEKIGDMDASSYWGRISWSAGLHLEQGIMHLMLGNSQQQVNEWGFGMGAALPMRKGRSLLSLSLSYSSMGSKDLLQRNCFTIGIGVSTCERWFVKRKYN
jgi:hypothetical protein